MDEKEKVVKKKRAFDFSLLIAIVLFLISLGMAGLFSWAIAGFRTNVLQDEAFWFSLVISVIINFFSLMAAVTYFLPKKSKNR